MNKAELIDRLSARLGSRRDATLAVESLVDVVIREVAAGGSVGITGFGTFERTDRAPRTGRNPRTGESVPIAGTSTPRFRPGTYFKAVVTDPEQLPSDGLAGGRAPAGAAPRTTATKKTAATNVTVTEATTRKDTSGKKSQKAGSKKAATLKGQAGTKGRAAKKDAKKDKGKSGKKSKK